MDLRKYLYEYKNAYSEVPSNFIYPQQYTATVSGKMLRGNFKIQSTLFENISKQVHVRSFNVSLKYPLAQSVERLTTGWTVRDRIPVGTRFSARPDRPWGPPSLL